MNRSEFWTIWSDVAENRREIAAVRQEMANGFITVRKTLADIQVSIADLRTEMIRKTSQNREDISKVNTLIDALEAAREQVPAE